VVSLTSARQAHSGSFSPDGTQIAFASAGEKGDNWDIWLKIPGEPEGRRLTTDPSVDDFPAWSPDGRLIAFLRHRDVPRVLGGLFDSTGFVHLVSPLGGSERRLSDVPARNQLSWSPDGRWLAMARVRGDDEAAPEAGGIHISPVGGGSPRPLTSPPSPAFDVCPAFSPDGRRLAYASCRGMGAVSCDIHVLPLDEDLRPAAPPRRLTQQSLWILGVAWTRDGRSIVYGTAEGSRIWRVRADGGAAPERVDLAGRGATYPATAGAGNRLAFVRQFWDVDIYRVNLGGGTTPLVESTLEIADLGAEYSPDGQRIAFFSNRGDEWYEIWLAGADGSNPIRLTHGPGSDQNSPAWSPDGRTIAFQSKSGNAGIDIWTIGVDGAGLRQVTRDAGDDQGPRWSPDGSWIYFLSNRSGRGEVFRAAAAGGTEEQVTHGGAYWHALSRDGRSLYYVKSARGSGLFARPTDGGDERPIIRCQSGYAVGPAGVFYVGCGSAEASTGFRYPLRYWDAATGQDRQVGAIDAVYVAGLSVSPDGRSLLYGRSSWACSLMMIEDFR
jgi:Tol biopolymer transport system component